MFLTPCSDGGEGGLRTGCSCHVISVEGQDEAQLGVPATLFRWKGRKRQNWMLLPCYSAGEAGGGRAAAAVDTLTLCSAQTSAAGLASQGFP